MWRNSTAMPSDKLLRGVQYGHKRRNSEAVPYFKSAHTLWLEYRSLDGRREEIARYATRRPSDLKHRTFSWSNCSLMPVRAHRPRRRVVLHCHAANRKSADPVYRIAPEPLRASGPSLRSPTTHLSYSPCYILASRFIPEGPV